MTLLSESPELWDTVFPESAAQIKFVKQLVRRADQHVLDVGCATGFLCGALRQNGIAATGVDINRRFIAAARTKDAAGEYHVGNMRTFRLKTRFDLLTCLGTTFSYNLTNRQISASLQNFKLHLKPGGRVVIDVLNAIAFTEKRPFKRQTQHLFTYMGQRAKATIKHRLYLRDQCMTEQVTWQLGAMPIRKDPTEYQRLLFPQELVFHLETSGFSKVQLLDSYETKSDLFDGRRLIAIATNPRKNTSKAK